MGNDITVLINGRRVHCFFLPIGDIFVAFVLFSCTAVEFGLFATAFMS